MRRFFRVMLGVMVLVLGASYAQVSPNPSWVQTTQETSQQTSQQQTSQQTVVPSSNVFDLAWEATAPFSADITTASTQAALADTPVYHIDLRLSDDLQLLTGYQEIYYPNQTGVTLNDLVLRLFPNLTGATMVVNVLRLNGAEISVSGRLEQQESILRVPLAGGLEPGAAVVVSLNFTLSIPDAERFYGRFGRYPDLISFAHSYPQVAMYLPNRGWDTRVPVDYADPVFALAARYVVDIEAPSGQTLVTSGVGIGGAAPATDPGRQRLRVAAGPARDFYWVSASNYQRQQRQVGNTLVNSYAPAELSSGSSAALDITEASLRLFNDLLGPYPFREFDIVAVPLEAGGMEHPGVVSVTNSFYRDPSGFFETIVAHEVAHQWFYNIVGNDQLGEPWLDEATAQYLTLRYYRDVYGEARAEQFRRDLERYWSIVDFAETPIGLASDDYNSRSYTGIVYGRGPLFFSALEARIGTAALDAGLRDYYQAQQWQNGSADALKNALENACGCTLSDLFATWVDPVRF